MTGKKISDEELKQEIEKGKTEKQIAYDNGYGYPSGALNERIRNLGYKANQKITVKDNGAGQLYLLSDPMQEMARQKNIDLQDVGNVFFRQVGSVEDGRIVLEMTTDSFREVKDE